MGHTLLITNTWSYSVKVGDLVKWTAEYKSDYAYRLNQGYGTDYGIIIEIWGDNEHPRILWNNGETWGTDKSHVEVISENR